MLGLIVLLAFYVAWNLGANDVANSMGTSVGSKAVTLKQAIIIAGILEFTGAVFFSQQVAATLGTEVINLELFRENPRVLMLGMISVLLASGIWLQIATTLGLPVSSSHAIIGAIAGFSWIAAGIDAVDWQNILKISLTWIVTPVISGAIAFLFYNFLYQNIIAVSNTQEKLKEWIPWLSGILVSIFGIIVFPSIIPSLFSLPTHTVSLCVGAFAVIGLSINSWRHLEDNLEKILGRFQVISACFVAFAHGSNDVGNAIAPLAVIFYILQTNTVPLENLPIAQWIFIVGGLGIVSGLAIQGKKVIATVGEGIIALKPSSGFSAEIATAATVLLASRFGLPVSTSHALIGAVVGIGLSKDWRKVQFSTLKSVIMAWVITVPLTGIISAIVFVLMRHFNS